MTSPSSRISMLVTPARQQATTGVPARITVIDMGKQPLRVSSRTVILHGKCAMTGTPDVVVRPASFVLAAGHSRVVHATVHGGPGDYGVAFYGTVQDGKAVSVATGVGSQVITGTATACTVHIPEAVPAAHTGGISPVTILLILLPFIAVAAIAYLLITRGTRNHPRKRQQHILSNGWE